MLGYYKSERLDKLGVFKNSCPICEEETSTRLGRIKKFIVLIFLPFWWYGDYILTCGKCFNDFIIDKESAKKLERRMPKEEKSIEITQMKKKHSFLFFASICDSFGQRLWRGY